MSIFSSIKDKIAQYLDVQVRLIKLNVIGRTANLLGVFMFSLICLLLLMCIMLYSGLGLVEAFMALGASKLVSFVITIGIYILLLLIVIGSRRKITRFMASAFIRAISEGDDENDTQSNNPRP